MTVNLDQIRADRKNGVIVSLQTWDALVAYASEMEERTPIAWHCVNNVTGKMLYTDSESQMIQMRDEKSNHWVITALSGIPLKKDGYAL